MKNHTLLFLFISLTIMQAKAQIPGGIFSQQAKKEKLLTAQIAELNIQNYLLGRGYHIKDSGLTTVHAFKDQSFELHANYFTSLEQVNPEVAKNAKVAEIYNLQKRMTGTFKKELDWQQREHQLSQKEMAYFGQVYNHLLAESQKDLNELTDLLTKGKLQLTDQQRLARVDQLYSGMKDKNSFAGYFTGKCRKLAMSRKQGSKEKLEVKKLYGIHLSLS
jgi:flagellar motility protein MotE (MotC chaperone)